MYLSKKILAIAIVGFSLFSVYTIISWKCYKLSGDKHERVDFNHLKRLENEPTYQYIKYVDEETEVSHPKVECVKEVAELYRPLIDGLNSELLATTLEAQHMAEVYAFREFCNNPEMNASNGMKNVYYVPVLPLLAYRMIGADRALEMMTDALKLLHEYPMYKFARDRFFTVCNHWAAPSLMQPMNFSDSMKQPDLYVFTFEENFPFETSFLQSEKFTQYVFTVPYVTTSFRVPPILSRQGFFYAGSESLASPGKGSPERVRQRIAQLKSKRKDLNIQITPNLRIPETEYSKCQKSFQTGKRPKTSVLCYVPKFGVNQWEVTAEHALAKVNAGTGMANAEYCLVPRGDSPGSLRYFDSISAGCIPIVISDDWICPFGDKIPFDTFTIRIHEADFITNPKKALDMAVASRDKSLMRLNLSKWRKDLLWNVEGSRVALRIAQVFGDYLEV